MCASCSAAPKTGARLFAGGRSAIASIESIGPPCVTDACYRIRVRAYRTHPLDAPHGMLEEALGDGGIGCYRPAVTDWSMWVIFLAERPGGCKVEFSGCTQDDIEFIARRLRMT